MELPDRDDRDDEAGAIMALLLEQFRAELMRQWKNGAREPISQFWEKFQSDLGDQLGVILFAAFLASVRFHSDGNELDQQAIGFGIAWSAEESRRLAGLITNHSREMLTQLLADIASGKVNEDEVGARLDRIFGKKRAGVIGGDAITDGQTRGGEQAWKWMGTDSMEDIWSNQPELSRSGPCPTCQSLDGTPRSYWSLLYPSGPPSPHPRCCCILVPASTP